MPWIENGIAWRNRADLLKWRTRRAGSVVQEIPVLCVSLVFDHFPEQLPLYLQQRQVCALGDKRDALKLNDDIVSDRA